MDYTMHYTVLHCTALQSCVFCLFCSVRRRSPPRAMWPILGGVGTYPTSTSQQLALTQPQPANSWALLGLNQPTTPR